jgi:hypothetical protein
MRKLAAIGAYILFLSCGGRVNPESTGTGDTGGTGNQGGSTTTTGGTTTGGTTTGGSTTGTTTGTTTGGATTTGGSATGGSNATGAGGASSGGQAGQLGTGGRFLCDPGCPPVMCPPGSELVQLQGACCPTCQPCKQDCPLIKCAGGSHAQTLPGQCCNTCVLDPVSCDEGRKMYESNRAQLLEKYSASPCKIDSECTLVPEMNRCVARCGVVLPVTTAGFFESNSSSFADTYCPGCPPSPIPPCARLFPLCEAGKCVAGPPRL